MTASANKAISKRIGADFRRAEITSLPVTLVILVFAFGALVAAGIPLLLGMTAVAAALGLTALLSHLLHVDVSINEVILLIGLAVGVDYSLFYLRRDREERARGRPPAEALQVAAATSGRAVLVSGLTVMTAMAGMFLMGSRVFWSFGIGHDARRRDRGRRLPHGAAGGALDARRPCRPRPDPVARPQRPQRRRLQALVGGRGCGAAPPGRLGRACGRGIGRSRHSRVAAAHRQTPASRDCLTTCR